MSRAKVNSDSLQIIAGGGGGGDIYMTNSEVNQYSNLQDNLNSQEQIGMFSFRNQKLNSLHSRNNEQNDKESIYTNKQGQHNNQNIPQNHSPINSQNQFYSFNQYPIQSGRQSQCSQQSIPYNPSSSLQTFGNASNLRKERESSNSQIESTFRQTQHHRYNSDASIINHTIKTAYSDLASQSFGINQGTQQNQSQNFKMNNNNNNIQQNQFNSQQQNQQNQHSNPQLNNFYQTFKKQDSHFSQKNYQNKYNQQERTNNLDYEESNLNQTQQQNHMRSNSLQQNAYQNNMKSKQPSMYQNNNNNNEILQQNFQQINNNYNQNFKSQSFQNQPDKQITNNNQNSIKQEIPLQNNNTNKSQHFPKQQSDKISQSVQQSHFNSQQSNNYQNQQHSNYSSQQQQQQQQNIQNVNQPNVYSQKYQPQQEKQYISIDKTQLSSINSGRNNQSNSQSLYFISPRSDSVFFNQNNSVQSQQGVFHISTYKINNQKQNVNQQQNSANSGLNNNSMTKDIDFIKDSNRIISQDLSPEDEFLIKFKKMKNNQFLNRPQSNNPEKRRKQSNYFSNIENEFNFTENINSNPHNLNDQSIQKINLSNNSYQNGINTNPNSNNNSFLARKASKKSNYINYPTHSKRKYDLTNTSGKKDSSQQDNSLILTKENNLDSQPHFIGSPLSPSGVIEHFSHKNSTAQEFNGKNIYKQDEMQVYVNTQNNNNNSLGSTMQSHNYKNNNNSNKYGSTENSHQKNPLSISNNKTNNFNSNSQNYSKSLNAEHPFKRAESSISSPNAQIKQNYNQIDFPNQNNATNKENLLQFNHHKDNLGRSQSAGLVSKKKIFNYQNLSNSPNIQKENKVYQNSPIQMSNETFQVDNKVYETKQKFQDENKIQQINQLFLSGIELNQKIQMDSAIILKSDEENLKKYIQLQNEINNSQTEVKQIKEESNSINLQNYKDARKNSKEFLLNQNKSRQGENANKIANNIALQLSQNQEKSLKKTAAEYLMLKASKQQPYSNSYNISGFTPQHIINRNQPSKETLQHLNYAYTNQKPATTLPTNHDIKNKITKYSDNFIKKKSLPTYQNTQTEENLQFQNYLVKNKLNSNSIQRNNFVINVSNPNQINCNNSLSHNSKYNECNKEKQKTPRMKIFDHETSQNHSINREKSRDISPNRNIIFNQPQLSKSPIGKDLEEKEGIISANNSIELRNSPFVSKNPQFKTQKQNIQLLQKPLESLSQLEPCDISESSIVNQNIPKQTIDSKHDKTQTYFSKVKNENKYDGIQQNKIDQQVQQTKDKQNEVLKNHIIEKQIYPLVVSEQFKQMYNKESSNFNQIVNTINHKKTGMLGSPTSQDNYLDQKYNRNNKNLSAKGSISNHNNSIFTPRITSPNENEKKQSIEITPKQLIEFLDENLKEILQNNENVEKMQHTYQDVMLLYERVQSFILQQQQMNEQQISQQQQLYNKNFIQLIETAILLAFQKLRAIQI